MAWGTWAELGLAKWTAATPFSVRFCFILKDFSVKLIVHIYISLLASVPVYYDSG